MEARLRNGHVVRGKLAEIFVARKIAVEIGKTNLVIEPEMVESPVVEEQQTLDDIAPTVESPVVENIVEKQAKAEKKIVKKTAKKPNNTTAKRGRPNIKK